MYVCNCEGVTEAEFNKMKDQAVTYKLCAQLLKQSGVCCKCLPQIKEIFNKEET